MQSSLLTLAMLALLSGELEEEVGHLKCPILSAARAGV
jgi:hypothetical protein